MLHAVSFSVTLLKHLYYIYQNIYVKCLSLGLFLTMLLKIDWLQGTQLYKIDMGRRLFLALGHFKDVRE